MFRFVFYLVFGFVVFNAPISFGDENRNIYKSVDDLIKDLDRSWEKGFDYVKDQVNFVPSPHFLKSSQGVLWGGRGNSKEQALLLFDILDRLGEKVRLVSGQLDRDVSTKLILSFFPQDKNNQFSYDEDVPLSQPSEDEDLFSNIKDHYWIQIYKDDKWLNLDPVFPKSVSGQKYAQEEKTFLKIPNDFFPKMLISLSIKKGDKREIILTIEERLQDLANRPVTLSISTSFKEAEGKDQSKGGSPAGIFGGLSGGSSGKKKVNGLEAIYRAELKIGKGTEISGEFREEIPESKTGTAPKNPINRVWLNFRLVEEGQVLIEKERVLFEKIQDADEMPLFQRHSILIAPNRIPNEAWEDMLSRVTDANLLDEIKSSVDEIKASIKTKQDKKILLDKSLNLEEKIGPELGHLINMIFAYSSDSITEEAGKSLSVYSFFTLPRIIIHSVAGDGEEVSTVMDLRCDSISAIPHPGQAVSMKETFLYGRGVFESVLEGKILELFLGKKALTTAFIMQEAAKRAIPIRLYSELEKDGLDKLAMPDHVRNQALKAIASGLVLIIPEQGIQYEGNNRWGWWEFDPYTWETIGVLDTGLHQAILQRTVLDTKGILNSKMGFAIGAISGAVDTQWMLASTVLKYGELSKKALQEIKAYMKQIKAYMCPEFEKTASEPLASTTIINIEDCYKKEFSLKLEGGVKIEMGWCQAFAKGFACASTSILNYYLSQYE